MYSPSIRTVQTTNPVRTLVQNSGFRFFIGFVVHLPLAQLMQKSSHVATLHAFTVLAIGLWFVLRDKQPIRVVYLTGYIIGAEVLWRMTEASIFWEFGKYAVSFLMILAILKWRHSLMATPLVYFALLLPSAIFTLEELPFSRARQELSFNLSGPFALAVAVLFFSQIRIKKIQLQSLLLITAMPIGTIASLTLDAIRSTADIRFTFESSFAASGGFGPNQVSAALGLGALLGLVYALSEERASKLRLLALGFSLWYLAQAILTFSRGGVFNFIVAALPATLYLLRDKRKAIRNFILFLLLIIMVAYLVLPWLNQFTGGVLAGRFGMLETTGRTEIVLADLKTWQNNFFFGVGPGRADTSRQRLLGFSVSAHTEYSRLLAEHGVFGLLSLILLFVMFFRSLRRARGFYARGLALGFMIWSLAEMTHAAMRLAAISYFFALPSSQFWENDR